MPSYPNGRGMSRSESKIRKLETNRWEQSRWYFVWFLFVLIIGLLVLFREFVFSDQMLFSGDVVLYGIFHRSLLAGFLHGAGPFPLWDPYVSCGLPYTDAIHGATFYPLAIIDYLGYLPRMVGFNMLAHFVLAGATTYLAGRQLGLSRGAATVTAVSYALSPCLLTWSAAGHEGKIYAAALFPLALFATERLITGGRWHNVALLGFVVGMIILTPHLQMAYYIILAILAFAVFRLVILLRNGLGRSTVLSRLAKMAAGVLLALAISSIQLIPSARYLLEFSPRADQEKGVEYAASWSLHAEEAVSLIFPDFCGHDKLYERHGYWGKNNIKDNSEAISIVTWLLAAIALALRRTRFKWFWAGLAVVTFLYALGTATPFFKVLVTLLPLFDMIRAPSTAMFLFVFALAILAGTAVDGIKQARLDCDNRIERRINVIILASITMTVLYALAMFLFPENVLRLFAQAFSPQLFSGGAIGGGRWERALAALPDIRTGAVIAVTLTAATGFLLWKRTGHRFLSLAPIALSFLIVLSNFLFAAKFIRTADPHAFFDQNPTVRVFAQTDRNARTMLVGANPVMFQLGYNGILNTTGYHGKELSSFADLADGACSPNALNPRFVNLTGTRYLICTNNETLIPNQFGPIPLDTLLRFNGYHLLQNRNSFPRAFLVSQYRVLPDAEAIRQEILHGTVDLSRVVLLETAPSLNLSGVPDSSARATIVSYGLNSVEIAVSCARDQMLVLTDNYYDAWHAEVHGIKTPIFRADGSFRAVEVPAGTHRIVFSYSSDQFKWGGRISVAGLVIFAGLMVSGSRRLAGRRRRSPKAPRGRSRS